MENGEIQLAAGATKVVVSVPNTRNYRVYSLPELKRETSSSRRSSTAAVRSRWARGPTGRCSASIPSATSC